MSTLFERVRDVVVAQLKVPAEEVKPEANLIDDLRADSLDIVDLTISLEEEFSGGDVEFEIRDEDAENIRTVQDILDFLQEKGVS
jgi:acyl carrier protein